MLIQPDNNELDPASIPDFLVSVVASTMDDIAEEGEFPVWSEFITLPDVTHDKPGGLKHSIGIPASDPGAS